MMRASRLAHQRTPRAKRTNILRRATLRKLLGVARGGKTRLSRPASRGGVGDAPGIQRGERFSTLAAKRGESRASLGDDGRALSDATAGVHVESIELGERVGEDRAGVCRAGEVREMTRRTRWTGTRWTTRRMRGGRIGNGDVRTADLFEKHSVLLFRSQQLREEAVGVLLRLQAAIREERVRVRAGQRVEIARDDERHRLRRAAYLRHDALGLLQQHLGLPELHVREFRARVNVGVGDD